jgi:hypothetical protein
MDIANSAGLATAAQQSQTQQQIGLTLLRSNLHQQRDAVATLLNDASNGGMVTASRGQAVNTTA